MISSNRYRAFFVITTLLIFSIEDSMLASEIDKAWYDKTEINGDFRLRYEGIYKKPGQDTDRERFRLRLGMKSRVNESINFIMRLESGAQDPVSSNQTIGDNFSGKDFGIGRSYIDWKINNNANIFAGKMKLPWIRPGGGSLLWDGDLNPEGIVMFISNERLFMNTGVTVIERSSDNSTSLFSFQGGGNFTLDNSAKVKIGYSVFKYNHARGNQPFYKSKGNTLDDLGNYLNDYTIFELFAEYKHELYGLPVTAHLDWLKNNEASDQDTAYSAGIKLGSSSKKYGREFSYTYHDTEKDAVIGAFSDSDFAGGVTDSKGHFIRARYGLMDNVRLGGTFIISKHGSFSGTEEDYNRMQLDLEFKF